MNAICIKTGETVETVSLRGNDAIKTTRSYVFACLTDAKGRKAGVQVVTMDWRNGEVDLVEWAVTEERDGKPFRNTAHGSRTYRSGIDPKGEAIARIKKAIRAFEAYVEKENPPVVSKI